MGSYSDATRELPFMNEEDYEAVSIIEATVDALADYRGILYGQYMLTSEGPKVIEFNARFGDPEAMNTLPVLETDFLDVLTAARDGEAVPELEFADQATVCKYAVPEGIRRTRTRVRRCRSTKRARATLCCFTRASKSGALRAIRTLRVLMTSTIARTASTTTSRSFALVGVADTITDAEEIAEDALAVAGDDGLHVRHDISKPDLVQQRIDHIEELRETETGSCQSVLAHSRSRRRVCRSIRTAIRARRNTCRSTAASPAAVTRGRTSTRDPRRSSTISGSYVQNP